MPSGLIKLIYTGDEEKVFYNNPNINLFHKIYKKYMNFSKTPYIIDFYTASDTTLKPNNTDIYLTQSIGNFIGSMTLEIELDNSELNFDIKNLFEKIELYCTNNILDIITPELLDIYSNMYYNKCEYNIYKNLQENNFRNKYFIQLLFPCIKKNSYIPLYLLDKENLYLKVYFNKVQPYNIKNMSLIIESIILDDLKYFRKNKYEWLIETINYIENIELKSSVYGERNNVIRLKDYFSKMTKCIICKFYNGNIYNLKLRVNNNSYVIDYEVLSKLNLLENNLNNNEYNLKNSKKLLVIPFSIFKTKISGFVNFNEVTNCDLEIKPFNNLSEITFHAVQILNNTDNFYFIETSLPKVNVNGGNKSPTILILRNIVYQLINTNTSVALSKTYNDAKNKTNLNSYELSEINELLVNDSSINELWYYDRILDIEPGKFEIKENHEYELDKSILNIYSVNYDIFSIYNGKLNIY